MTKKIGRNDPCPCGSGKKYKNCCLKKTTALRSGKLFDAGTLIEYMYKNNAEFREMSERHHQEYIERHMPKTAEEIEIVKKNQQKLEQNYILEQEHQKEAEKKWDYYEKCINENSFNEIKKKADEGDGEAMFMMGLCYYEARGVERDYAKSYETIKHSAESGYETARAFEKGFSIHGVGIKPNIDRAFAEEDIDEIDNTFFFQYYTRGYYAECGNFHVFCMKEFFSDFEKADINDEKEEAFLQRYHRYSSLLYDIADQYVNYCNKNLYGIKTKYISDQLLEQIGIESSRIDYWRESNQLNEQKRCIADYLSMNTVTCKYLNEVLEDIVDKIYDILLDFDIDKEEKKEGLDKYWFLYDVIRLFSGHFLTYCYETLNVYDESAYAGVVYVDKETCITLNPSSVYWDLYSLSYPYDFRACRMLFDLYRLEDDFDKAEWAFIYLYNFINYNFIISCDETSLKGVFIKPNEMMEKKAPIEYVLKVTIEAINKSIDLYDSLNGNVTGTDFVFLENPRYEDALAQGVGTKESQKSLIGRTRNLQFALTNSLPAIDFMIEASKYILDREVYDENIQKVGITTIDENFKKLYSMLKKTSYRLIERVYRDEYEYEKDAESKGLSIKNMENKEAEIERQMEICDGIDILTEFVSLQQIEKYYEGKKRLLERIKNVHPKTRERLETGMERISAAIRKMLTENNYNSKYLDEIDNLISEKITNHDKYDFKVFRTALASGEFLYQTYIREKGKNLDFDYSFVAVQYYTALESLLKKVFYEPYIQSIEKEKNIKALSQEELAEYFPKENIPRIAYKKGNYEIKTSSKIELGPIGFVLANNDKPEKLIHYLINELNTTDEEIIQYGSRIKEILNPRNKAAHGNETVSYEEAKLAKATTFDKEEINHYKGLILDFLNMMSNS